jgi:hypothetical protein
LPLLSLASKLVPPYCAQDARCGSCRHPPPTYSTPYPAAVGSNANGKLVPGPSLLPTNAHDVDGLGCFLSNFLYVDFLGDFDSIFLGIEDAVSVIIHLIDPVFTGIGCTLNFLVTNESNKYECAAATLDSKCPFPNASDKQTGLDAQDRTSEHVMHSNT